MSRWIAIVGLLTTQTAYAGTLFVEKKGLVPVFAFVDGEDHGQVKGKTPLELELAAGTHEVWLAAEETGTVTLCRGLVEVGDDELVVSSRMTGCEGLIYGKSDGATAWRGATAKLSMQVPGFASIDGGRRLALPGMNVELNLTPGRHDLVITADPMGAQVLTQGTFTLAAGETLPMSCTIKGCTGLDQPPEPPPQPVAAAPAPAATPASPAPASSAPLFTDAPQSGGSSEQTCCVNKAFYVCPTTAAVYKCTGDFMQCQLSCSLSDFDCTDRCLKDHPIDPSDCSRTPARDGECN